MARFLILLLCVMTIVVVTTHSIRYGRGTPTHNAPQVSLQNKYGGLLTSNRKDLAMCTNSVDLPLHAAERLRDRVIEVIPKMQDEYPTYWGTWLPPTSVPVRVEVGCPENAYNGGRWVEWPSEYQLFLNVVPDDAELDAYGRFGGETLSEGGDSGVGVTYAWVFFESQLCDDAWLESILVNLLGMYHTPDGAPVPPIKPCPTPTTTPSM